VCRGQGKGDDVEAQRCVRVHVQPKKENVRKKRPIIEIGGVCEPGDRAAGEKSRKTKTGVRRRPPDQGGKGGVCV